MYYALLLKRLSLFFCIWSGLFPSEAFPFTVTVKTVLDGDSIVLTDGTKVRYFGINTPERGQPFSEQAKQFNEKLVHGKQVEIVPAKKKRDGYGRVLVYVFVDGNLVNARLIQAGLAYVFTFGPFQYADEWLALQQQAQEQRIGMWRARGTGQLRITAVRADAKGDDRKNLNGEYVRVCNVSAEHIDLTGFRLTDAANHAYIFPAETLAPGYTALILSGKGKDRRRGGQLLLHWGATYPIWNNTEDTASLYDPDGQLIDTFQIQKKRR